MSDTRGCLALPCYELTGRSRPTGPSQNLTFSHLSDGDNHMYPLGPCVFMFVIAHSRCTIKGSIYIIRPLFLRVILGSWFGCLSWTSSNATFFKNYFQI